MVPGWWLLSINIHLPYILIEYCNYSIDLSRLFCTHIDLFNIIKFPNYFCRVFCMEAIIGSYVCLDYNIQVNMYTSYLYHFIFTCYTACIIYYYSCHLMLMTQLYSISLEYILFPKFRILSVCWATFISLHVTYHNLYNHS